MWSIICGGIIFGALYFILFEQFDTTKMPNKCWTTLHYMSKQFSPLYAVHLKSIVAGIVLIIIAYDFPQVVIFIGASIIGLHILQAYNELHVIESNKK